MLYRLLLALVLLGRCFAMEHLEGPKEVAEEGGLRKVASSVGPTDQKLLEEVPAPGPSKSPLTGLDDLTKSEEEVDPQTMTLADGTLGDLTLRKIHPSSSEKKSVTWDPNLTGPIKNPRKGKSTPLAETKEHTSEENVSIRGREPVDSLIGLARHDPQLCFLLFFWWALTIVQVMLLLRFIQELVKIKRY